MPTIEQAFQWLLTLPPGALYAAAFGLALAENLVPPLPSDVLIGFCALIAAAGGTPPSVIFWFVVFGTGSGAAITYALGRRYGSTGVRARLEAKGLIRREQRMEAAYERWGLAALFLGRLVPGVRAVVALFAGALRINAFFAVFVMTTASAIWYGILIWIASRVGANWRLFVDQLGVFGRWGGGVAVVLALAAGAVWWWFRHRGRNRLTE